MGSLNRDIRAVPRNPRLQQSAPKLVQAELISLKTAAPRFRVYRVYRVYTVGLIGFIGFIRVYRVYRLHRVYSIYRVYRV